MVVIGLAIAGFFLRLGPSVSMKPLPLSWTQAGLDAGEREVQFTVSGVEFARVRDATEPMLSFAALFRDGQHVAINDFNYFHAVERQGRRVFVLGEIATEGPGPLLELLVSEDDGLTFEHRASIPKPNYLASFEQWTIQGDVLTVVISLDDELPLASEWLWPGPQLRSSFLGPGRFVLRSKNGGRTWRLER